VIRAGCCCRRRDVAWSVFRSDSLCSLLFFALPVFVFASVLTLIAISVERCVHPPSYSPFRIIQESVFSFIRQLSVWHCPRLLLSAGACCTAHLLQARRAEIDRCLLSAGLSAANLQQRRAASGRTVGQTDRRTPNRYVDPPSNTMRAVSMRAASAHGQQGRDVHRPDWCCLLMSHFEYILDGTDRRTDGQADRQHRFTTFEFLTLFHI